MWPSVRLMKTVMTVKTTKAIMETMAMTTLMMTTLMMTTLMMMTIGPIDYDDVGDRCYVNELFLRPTNVNSRHVTVTSLSLTCRVRVNETNMWLIKS